MDFACSSVLIRIPVMACNNMDQAAGNVDFSFQMHGHGHGEMVWEQITMLLDLLVSHTEQGQGQESLISTVCVQGVANTMGASRHGHAKIYHI